MQLDSQWHTIVSFQLDQSKHSSQVGQKKPPIENAKDLLFKYFINLNVSHIVLEILIKWLYP